MKKFFLTFLFLLSIKIFSADSDIRLNSLGFLPNQQKRASIATTNANIFYLKKALDNSIVFTGNLSYFGFNSDTAETIYIADFSNFAQYGTYYIEVPGVGRSFNFDIRNDIYYEPFYLVFRAFYLWRCGCAVSQSYKGNTFSHSICHTNDAYQDFIGGGHIKKDGTGGWHDAGDYGKYVVNAGVTMGVLMKAWEHFEDKIRLVNLNIPNVLPNDELLPDYLKELKWEIEWLKKMQASDGKVYHKLTAQYFEGNIMPEYDYSDRYFSPYSTAATADFTAIMAMAARIFAPYDSDFASDCLEKARISYSFLTHNPSNVYADLTGFYTGTYQSPQTNDLDDRLWAAAELWETTGEQIFLNDFETRAASYSNKIEWAMDWGNVKDLGMFTYYFSTRTGKNQTIVNAIKNDTLTRANLCVNARNSHGYGRNLGDSYWWGSNGVVARLSLTLYMAYKMQPNQAYIDTILDALGFLFGRNYYCRSFVTGLGNHPPKNPHHRPSYADGILEPWPGYLVGGPATDKDAKTWQDDYNSYQTNEVAINWNSALVYAMAGFIDTFKTPTLTPTITGTPPTETMTPTVTVTLTITPILDTIEIAEFIIYPNPNKGKKIIFRYKLNGYADYVKISIYTLSGRKIYEIWDKKKQSYIYHETVVRPNFIMANGLYYYIVEFINFSTNFREKIAGAFYIIN